MRRHSLATLLALAFAAPAQAVEHPLPFEVVAGKGGGAFILGAPAGPALELAREHGCVLDDNLLEYGNVVQVDCFGANQAHPDLAAVMPMRLQIVRGLLASF